jgi:hypothetical protein
LALNLTEPAAFDFILHVERFYESLLGAAVSDAGREPSLGGKLLYAGDLDGEGRGLMVAGNIAGAASLAATADLAVQKQAIREGVADFLVTSLDEALRILKNEIRKRETVAVCVAAAPQAIEGEMLERGVLPDLLRTTAASAPACRTFLRQGAHPIQLPSPAKIRTLLTWQAAAAFAQWLPRLDALALDCLKLDDWYARRWLRFAPRYLGRLAQGVRLLGCDEEFATDFIERVRCRVESGEVGVAVEIQVSRKGVCLLHRFAPPGDGESGI